MNDPLLESHNAEALNAVVAAEEARQKAAHISLVNAFREVLTDEGGSPLLIKRIPFICTDIGEIKKSQDKMMGDFWWMKWIGGVGVSLATVIGLPIAAWIILQIIDDGAQIAALVALMHK